MAYKFKSRTFMISVFLILVIRNINFNRCEINNPCNSGINNLILKVKKQLNKMDKYTKFKIKIKELLKEINEIEKESKQQNSASFILGPIFAVSQAIKEEKIEKDLKKISKKLFLILNDDKFQNYENIDLKDLINENQKIIDAFSD